jgi:hypothetical protein
LFEVLWIAGVFTSAGASRVCSSNKSWRLLSGSVGSLLSGSVVSPASLVERVIVYLVFVWLAPLVALPRLRQMWSCLSWGWSGPGLVGVLVFVWP